MTEKTNEQGPKVEESGANVEAPKEEVIDVKAEIAKAILDTEKRMKTEIAGLNRKNNEYQEELRLKEMEGKTAEEQKALALQEKERIELEIVELNRSRIVDRELHNAGLPLEFAKRISGMDEESVKADIKSFNDFVEQLVKERTDKTINNRLGGVAPAAGESPKQNSIDEQIKQAQQAQNFTRVMDLKEQKRQEINGGNNGLHR